MAQYVFKTYSFIHPAPVTLCCSRERAGAGARARKACENAGAQHPQAPVAGGREHTQRKEFHPVRDYELGIVVSPEAS